MRSQPSILALLVLTFGLLPGQPTPAQDPPAAPPASGPAAVGAQAPSGIGLVDFDVIQAHVAPPAHVVNRRGRPLRVLDARVRADFVAGHVPDAIWVDVKKAQEIAGRPGGLDDRAAWADWVGPLGLTPDYSVVVMDGARQLDAARIWWLLRYLGVERVGLADGNVPLWKAQGRPTQVDALKPEPTTIAINLRRDRLATRDDVLATLKSKDARVVDARTVEEFVGQKLLSKRGGHIPTACRLEWAEFIDNDGRFLPKDQIEAKVAAAGIRPGEPVIAHCQGGGRASVDAFVFEMLGHPARNYYLSWADWGNADDTPIEGETKLKVEPAPTPGPAPAQDRPATPDPAPPNNLTITFTPATIAPPVENRPFTVEYLYKAKWGHADEFLALFKKNHLPVLREREKQGDILSIAVSKPRIHAGEADRWDFRVTLVFKDPAHAFDPAADEPIKQRLFPDQAAYRAEEQRRFEILESHTDLPIEAVPLD